MRHVILFAFLAGACSSTPDTPVENPREEIREQVMSDASNCFMDRAEYCIGDAAFIDAIIDERLAALHGGEMPTMRRAVDRFAGRVSGRYILAQLETDASRDQVEHRMEAYYANPPIRMEEGEAKIDAGWIPVGLVTWRNSWTLAGAESPLHENYQPTALYIARQLLRARAQHPDARVIEIEARTNRGFSLMQTQISWMPGSEVVWVTRSEGNARTTQPVGANLENLLNGTVSLVEDMHSCSYDGAALDPLCP